MNIDPEVYLKAAELIEMGEINFACWAIAEASLTFKEIDKYTAFFKPDNNCTSWFGDYWHISNQNDRVMSLLLMFEIAKDLKRGEG